MPWMDARIRIFGGAGTFAFLQTLGLPDKIATVATQLLTWTLANGAVQAIALEEAASGGSDLALKEEESN